MHDDSPWKPPSEAGDPVAPESVEPQPPTVPSPAPVAPTSSEAPTLPDAPILPDAPTVPAAPTTPPVPNPSAAPTLPPSVPPPAPAAPPESPWAPGGSGAMPPSAPPPPPGPAPAPPSSMPPAPVPPGPLVEPGPPAEFERPRRSKWLVGGAVAAVLAVGGAGVFAVSNLTGSTAGGAAGPEELGLDFLGAIENEDLLGVIDVLLPGERESLGEPFVEMVSELQRLEVLAETDLSQISGLDIELSSVDVQVRSTNVDDIVNIDLRADVVVSVDGAELPIGDLITDNLDDEAITEMRGTTVTQSEELDIWLTAVESDGRWYFSLLHSIAELARGEAAPGSGIPAEGVGADGAETPDAAVEQILGHIEDIDLTGMIRSLNPGEASALQRYAPLFLEDANSALAEVPLRWSITDREIRIDGEGDARTAFVDALAIEGDLDGSAFSFAFRDGCVRAAMDGESFEQCTDTLGGTEGIEDFFGDDPDVMRLFDAIESAFDDVEPAGIELRRHDGLWYVSPIGTVSEAFLKVLRALDRDELDEIISAFGPAFGGLDEVVFESMDELTGGGGLLVDDGFTIDELDELTLDDLEGLDDLDDFDPFDDEGPAWFTCYEEFDTAAATACFESYVESGDIDRTEMPVVLRHPECGYAELSWSNEIYSLPDAEFIAAAEAAQGCFQALVDSGEVSPWELPSEITQLECFEGRNWYQVFDDPDYDERYYECIGAGFGD